MNFLKNTLAAALLLGTSMNVTAKTGYFKAAGVTIALLDSAAGATATLLPDEYTAAHTPFDLAIRLDKETGNKEQDYLNLAAADIQNWPTEEQEQLQKAFKEIDQYLSVHTIKLALPDTIELIKTSGKAEFGAEGWTRRNRIMLNTHAEPISTGLVAHELFHVLSRNSVQTRNAAYAVFHFRPCNNVNYKPAMNNQVITNPDCPFIMHYIRVNKDGGTQDVALMLYAKTGYHKGYTMGDYMTVGLLALTGDDQHKKPLLKDGKPVIYELADVPDLLVQMGMNTPYMLHVEEVCAEHFAALITARKVKQPEYVEELGKILKD